MLQPYGKHKIIESSSAGVTARRNAVRNLLAQAVDLMKPHDWPLQVEMELLRLNDKTHQGDVSDDIELPKDELARRKAAILRERELSALIDEE